EVVVAHHAEMIGHDIDDQPQAMLVQDCDQAIEILAAAEIRIELRMIDHVIAMQAAGPRLENGRGIDVADTQASQIRNDACRIVERELVIELQPIRGARNIEPRTRFCRDRLTHGAPRETLTSQAASRSVRWAAPCVEYKS